MCEYSMCRHWFECRQNTYQRPIQLGNESTDFKAPHHIFIKAGVVHELVALEDDTLAHCIHAMRDGSRVEDIVDPASVPTSYHIGEVDVDFYPLTEDELKLNTV